MTAQPSSAAEPAKELSWDGGRRAAAVAAAEADPSGPDY